MLCRFCGKEISRDALFCPYCKRSTYVAPSAPEPDDPSNSYQPQSAPSEKQSPVKKAPRSGQKAAVPKKISSSRKLIRRMICLLLICGAALVYMSYGTIVTIPDPGQFMNLSASKAGTSGHGTHKHTATVRKSQDFLSDVREYVEYLEDQCNLEVTWESHKSTSILGIQYLSRYALEYDGFWIPVLSKPSISVDYYTNDDGNLYCTVHYDQTVGIRDYSGSKPRNSSQSVKPEVTPEEISTQPPKSLLGAPPSPDSTLLPDIGAYLGVSMGDSHSEGTSWDIVMTDSGEAAVKDILALVKDPRYQLVLDDTVYEDYKNTNYQLTVTSYIFDYIGTSGNISSGRYASGLNFNHDVVLAISRYASTGKLCIALYHDSDFTFEDPGVRTSQKIQDFYGSSRPSDPSINPITPDPISPTLPKIKTECSKCRGEKKIDCSNCNGVGYKIKRESVPNYSGSTAGSKWAETKEQCFKCNGSKKVTCDKCNGSGKE